jgi:hypothetical protein
MAVLTGRNGELRVQGVRIAKCRNFSVDISRDALETTTLGVDDRTYAEGMRGATGSAVILYDEDDAATRQLLNSILATNSSTSIELILNTSTNRALACTASVTQVSTPVSVGEVTACNVSFQVSGPIGGGF